MKLRLLMALTIGVGVVGWSPAGPMDGPTAFRLQVPASKPSQIGEAEFTREFKGGERAAVLVIGDHKPVVDLEVRVYQTGADDASDRLIARDAGGKDVVGAVWVPARTGRFRVVIRNPSEFKEKINPYNDCYVVIK